QKVDGNYDTAGNIVLMREKILNTTIRPSDSSIIIDNDMTTSKGTGYSEMNTGKNVARCRVHFFMNSTSINSVSYDIYYTLYSGADFLSVEVRNIE
ncbi:hypothetical protein HZA99_03370, partial [Candidatus Woesearchaeota archaeon]|nr:hypothetical protein [Candidatus Woesearchaeota archaeon]